MFVAVPNGTRICPAAFACCTVKAPSSALMRVPQTAPLGVVILIKAGTSAARGDPHHQVPIAATKSRSDPAIANLARRSRADAVSASVRPAVRSAPAAAESVPGRRGLQICLGLLWLLDATLQYQSFMFGQVS